MCACNGDLVICIVLRINGKQCDSCNIENVELDIDLYVGNPRLTYFHEGTHILHTGDIYPESTNFNVFNSYITARMTD